MAEMFPPVSSRLLTLAKIRDSENEMVYITKMRNIIKNQVGSRHQYQYLRITSFEHVLVAPLERERQLETCLRYALSKVVKSNVLLENYRRFRGWRIIRTNRDGIPTHSPNPGDLVRRERNVELHLVTTFKHARRHSFDDDTWSISDLLQRQLWTNNRLHSFQLRNQEDYSSAWNNSIWRRVYANNYSYFYSSDADMTAYVMEQTRRTSPIRVLNEISMRERVGSFNQLGILEDFASPYYYVLPHQIERNNCKISREIQKVLNSETSTAFREDDNLFFFKSRLNVAKKEE
ncbi:uncharacterized protein TNIN_164891 [Trichonephila inaurata madagascariensis]|uniref:Uncharacterized protein n=1 Tax=Trichonephila inaurata madagascariensis TaxID=2747483 RepID=A0A8X6X9P6_9ARAC|nr:uncharacterized protein TNIN_164891 [Trichonephila inaurata madagascariensis]